MSNRISLGLVYSASELVEGLPLTEEILVELVHDFGLVPLNPPSRRWERHYLSDDVIDAMKRRNLGERRSYALDPPKRSESRQRRGRRSRAKTQGEEGAGS